MKPSDSLDELTSAYEALRAAATQHRDVPWPARRARLQALQRLLTENEPAIVEAIAADFQGRPATETTLAEIWPSLEEVKTALKQGRRWMAPRRAPVGKWFLPARAQVLPQPLGVVGVIVPWNYPLFLAAGPMVAALAAGNRVMVKMSELTPTFSALFQRLCQQAFSQDEVQVVLGGPDVAAAFSALPFDHLLFTGSTPVGRKVMFAASQNLTPVTLELGGKSPAVITPGYPLGRAVQRILAGKLINAGQTCIAPDYVLLPRDQVTAFTAEARALAQRCHPTGLADPDYCSVINARHHARLTQWLGEAREQGAQVVPLFEGPATDTAAHRMAPQIVVDAPADSTLMTEEIFGPLLPLVPYDRLEDAVAHINSRPHPLALYWFDRDTQRTEQALRQLPAGGVTVNDTLLHITQHTLPFGGVGASGMGHYHGRWGFDTFSKLLPVFKQSRFNAMALFLPPYRPLMRRLLALMKRY